jgi:hypothetical protein
MNIQSIKNLPIISESVTIDVTPLSRYGHTNDLAKVTANIRLAQPMQETTRFLLPNCDSVKAPKVYLPDGTAIVNNIDTIAEDDVNQLKTPILSSIQTFLDTPNGDSLNKIVELITTYNDYKQSTNVMEIPAGQDYITFSCSKLISKDDSTGINTLETIVPLSSFTLNNQPGSKANIIVLMPFEITDVNNVVEAKWTAPNGTPQDLNKEVHAGRIILSQYWQYDPSVVVKYKY